MHWLSVGRQRPKRLPEVSGMAKNAAQQVSAKAGRPKASTKVSPLKMAPSPSAEKHVGRLGRRAAKDASTVAVPSPHPAARRPRVQPCSNAREGQAVVALAASPPSAAKPVEAESTKWDSRFLTLAKHIASWSKDPSTKVGCIIVGEDREIRSTGFNGFPRGITDSEERYQNREEKMRLVCHAEENAIMHAARIGVSLKGCTSFCTWPPCTRCARSLVQAGVTEMVYPKDIQVPERWIDDFNCSKGMMEEVGIHVRQV